MGCSVASCGGLWDVTTRANKVHGLLCLCSFHPVMNHIERKCLSHTLWYFLSTGLFLPIIISAATVHKSGTRFETVGMCPLAEVTFGSLLADFMPQIAG